VHEEYEKKKDLYEIKGFEKGQAPFEKVLEVYGETALYQNVINAMVGPVYEFGVAETGVKTIGRPVYEDVSVTPEKEMVFTFSVSLYPEVTLGQYRGLKARKETAAVTEEDIMRAIAEEQAENGNTVEVTDRPARLGDTVIIDFEGFLDGVPFDGGKAEGYPLELGSHSFVPGFEEQLVGMNIGESKDINITFPANYTPDLAGKDVVFKIKLHKILAREETPLEISEEYKASVRAALERKMQEEAMDNFHKAILGQAMENMEVALTERLIRENAEAMIRDYAGRMGMDPSTPYEQIRQMMGIDEDALKEKIYPAAEEQIRLDLLINAIIREEEIAAEEEAVADFAARMAGGYGVSLEEIRNHYDEEALKRLCKKDIALTIILESATEL
ncbi:MAG: trigger factor, partial [Lachnospiraceae bacterium]|nr:trigger factor [Lachnospiraceae bacterium]